MSGDDWTTYEMPWAPRPKPASGPRKRSALLTLAFFVLCCCLASVVFWQANLLFRKSLNASIVSDALKQYEIVSEGESPLEKSIRAGVVAEAYLMSHDKENYRQWKELSDGWQRLFEKENGIPSMR